MKKYIIIAKVKKIYKNYYPLPHSTCSYPEEITTYRLQTRTELVRVMYPVYLAPMAAIICLTRNLSSPVKFVTLMICKHTIKKQKKYNEKHAQNAIKFGNYNPKVLYNLYLTKNKVEIYLYNSVIC